MKAVVDQETCTGCELCTQICPEVFAMTDEGKAEAIVDSVPAENEDSCREAADSCPVEAIAVE